MAGRKRKERPPLKMPKLSERQRIAVDDAADSAIQHSLGLLKVPLKVDPQMRRCVKELETAHGAIRDRVLRGARTLGHQDQVDLQHVIEDGIAWEKRQLREAPTQAAADTAVARISSYMEVSDHVLGPRKDAWIWVEYML